MIHYPKAIFAFALMTITPLFILLALYANAPLGFAALLGFIIAAPPLCRMFLEAFADGEESDNTEDKESADEKPEEEYKEDETDLYDIIVNKPAETTADEKPVETDAITETTDGTDGTAETVAEDETDDKA